jgi:death-on-curing protein
VNEPLWLDREDCLGIHEMMLSQHGGLSGVRDEGLLLSAIAKPRNHFACGSESLAVMAASYAAGTVLNHPFLEGNKRTGFITAATFLDMNGLELTASEESAVQQTVSLASGQLTEEAFADWLKANCRQK